MKASKSLSYVTSDEILAGTFHDHVFLLISQMGAAASWTSVCLVIGSDARHEEEYSADYRSFTRSMSSLGEDYPSPLPNDATLAGWGWGGGTNAEPSGVPLHLGRLSCSTEAGVGDSGRTVEVRTCLIVFGARKACLFELTTIWLTSARISRNTLTDALYGDPSGIGDRECEQ